MQNYENGSNINLYCNDDNWCDINVKREKSVYKAFSTVVYYETCNLWCPLVGHVHVIAHKSAIPVVRQ